ncbi:citrate synthase [Anaerococcus sp. AGMB09787]|uniref:citrate synthase n=1 Tax=Anaerococcus sp. AGMB09787 TaxID=2922869 RepID=UPI001FAE86F6|nr:citrate synthase [Anaerococcus sp. AGMB09787]
MDESIKKLANYIEKYNSIDKNLYDIYDIKRGLRNKDGTGVLVGITSVGDVSGYKIENGEKTPSEGSLFYRGYSINDLVKDFDESERFGFEEVIYLLLFNKLPCKKDLDFFKEILVEERKLPENFLEDVLLKIPGKNIMNKMMLSMLNLYSYDENPDNLDTLNVLKQSISLISKMPIIMAYSYQAKKHFIDGKSLVIHYPKKEKSIAENILHLIRNEDNYTDLEAKILDLLLIIHAEHGGGNNSAFATHVVSSSGTDTYSAIATGLASLKGPRHGGANLKVSKMLDDIEKNIDNIENKKSIEDYLNKILEKKAFDKKGLIYGLGHAVYTLSDPRAKLLKQKAKELAIEKNFIDKYKFIESVEEIGGKLIQEKYKNPYPACANVDLYSGFVYEILDIEKELYTPLFAISRISGWSAHRLEQIQDNKIIRPAYKSFSKNNKYIKLDER